MPSGYRNNSYRDNQSGQITKDHSLLELVYPNGTILRIKDELDLVDLRALIHLYD